jgi:hypothetical protein
METVNTLHNATVKIVCGSDRGTAFFISNKHLLTARHNIISYLVNQEDILIELNNQMVQCTLLEQIENIDFVLIEAVEAESNSHLELVNMPIDKGLSFQFYGYSNSLIGQHTGISLKIKIQDYFHQINSDFDSTALIIDSYQPTVFKGFSGSPVYAAENKVVGIVVKKLDGCIGFVSTKLIVEKSTKVQELGISVLQNHSDFIENSYSKRANKKLLEKAFRLAGQRFERELHQPNNLLESKFEQLWNLEKYNEITKYITETDELIKQFIQDKNIKIPENINLIEQELNNNSDLFFFYWSINKNEKVYNKDDQLINFEKKEIEQMDSFRSRLRYIQTNSYNLQNSFIIKGLAGVGKTHLMCKVSETIIQNTNVYLCFGTEFNEVEDPITQLQRIFDFENSNFLEILNQEAVNKKVRYIFIVDALNEGAGDNYWSLRMPQLLSEFSKYSNIVIVTTVRSPFERKIFPTYSGYYDLKGFENTDEAINIYFDHYDINKSEVNSDHYDFKNGLFLKIFCETHSTLPYYDRINQNTYTKLFRAYIQRKEFDIAKKIDEDEKRRLGLQLLRDIAKYSVNNLNCDDIERQQARKFADRLCPYRTWSHSLLYAVIYENLLLENIVWSSESEKWIDTLSYAYERLGDFLKAIYTANSGIQNKELSKKLQKLFVNSNNDSKVRNYVIALNVVWNEFYERELIDDLDLSDNQLFIECFIDSIPLRANINDTSFIRKLIDKSLDREFGARSIINFFSYKQNNNTTIGYIHSVLKKMDLAKRDLVWTTSINELYVNGELSQYYSIEIIQDIIRNKTEKDSFHYVIFLTWLLSSSHPVVRDRVTRILYYILREKKGIITNLLNAFDGVNDLYVLERLYCAIYGVVLVSEDQAFIEHIAVEVYNRIYKDNKPPCNIVLREWTLKILDRAKYLGVQVDLFDKSLPPFENNIELPADVDFESFLGESRGSKAIYQSVFGFMDFARYIIGTNSDNMSDQFTKNKLIDGLTGEIAFYSLNEIQKMIISEVHRLGWNDDLGKINEQGLSYNRYKNDTERIGKKYQWLALYDVVARITDNYLLHDRWYSNKIREKNYPWLTSYHSYFDPTLPIHELEAKSEFDIFQEFVSPQIIMGNEKEWLESNEELPDLLHFEQIDKKGDKWILLSTYDSYKTEQENVTKEFFLRYDSVFVTEENAEAFQKWAKDKNYYGRWMPEWHDNIDYMLFEYNWSIQYNSIGIQINENPGYDCPCEVFVSTEAQLQEDANGTSEDYLGTTLLPNHDMMTYLNLKHKNERGLIFNDKNELVAIYNRDITRGQKGLYIKQDVLDKYLSDKKYILAYYILGEKNYKIGGGYHGSFFSRDLSAAGIYKAGELSVIQPLHVIEKVVENEIDLPDISDIN